MFANGDGGENVRGEMFATGELQGHLSSPSLVSRLYSGGVEKKARWLPLHMCELLINYAKFPYVSRIRDVIISVRFVQLR